MFFKSWIIGIFFTLNILLCFSSQARWLKNEEAGVQLESNNIQIQVKEDGRAQIDDKITVKIINEEGRSRWGTHRFNYSPRNQTLEILDAIVENDGKV